MTTNPESRSVGQQVDDLVAEIETVTANISRHTRDLFNAEMARRDRLGNLIELIGRPAAAKLLGITPRELAGLLRSGGR